MQHDNVRVLHAPQHLDLSQNLEVDALFLGTCHSYFLNGDLQIVLFSRGFPYHSPLAGAQRGADGVLVHRSLSGAAAARALACTAATRALGAGPQQPSRGQRCTRASVTCALEV